MSRFFNSGFGRWLLTSVGVLGCLSTLACGPRQDSRLNLLFISLDTTRQDHLQVYGYDRETSPELANLARSSVVFTSAFAQETSTAPSHASMFTGQYPFNHGVMANEFHLAAGTRTLAEILTESDYSTGAFVSGWTMAARTSGLDRGFQIYDDDVATIRRLGAETVIRALEWLHEEASEPFFLFVHLFDSHGPYEPPLEFQQIFTSDTPGPELAMIPPYQQMLDTNEDLVTTANAYIDRYDAAIRFTDSLVAALVDSIDLDTTVVVVIGDHGETLTERYWSVDHGGHVADEQTRIPLLIRVPGLAARRIDALVESVDLMPTLTTLLGLESTVEPSISGRSLLPLVEGRRDDWRPFVFSSAKAVSDRYADRGYDLNSSRKIYGVRSKEWKLIHYPGTVQDYWELYDLRSDPLETRNVAVGNPEVVQELSLALRDWLRLARQTEFQPVDLSEEERNKLLALGYVE